MRESYAKTPVYTGDVSGVASALYELGGMVVIHDPSGCNSTYNTHDETRWYDKESLIFISGLAERDAILGNDQKFIEDIIQAADQFAPKFIAICNSPIPYLNGTDFKGISHLIEKRTGIPTFYVETNGMHDYVRGAGQAFLAYAEKFLSRAERDNTEGRQRSANNADGPKVNLLGMTPLDFAKDSSLDSLQKIVEEAGYQINSVWSMGDHVEGIDRSAEADLNLVLSAIGYPLAKWLEENYGIPYVCGIPTHDFREEYFARVKDALTEGKSQIAYLPSMEEIREEAERTKKQEAEGIHRDHKVVALVGEPVTMGSFAAGFRKKSLACQNQKDFPNLYFRLIVPLEADPALTGPMDYRSQGEEETHQAMEAADLIVGDPLYAPIVPDRAKLCGLPQLAYSGRIYLPEIPDLFTVDLLEKILALLLTEE
ncbi:MAG: nitrogenase component 1 [Lachnospiraceae bacterium]|nr:nitrogenase component 1 [Lachnospiraceae bacterium]